MKTPRVYLVFLQKLETFFLCHLQGFRSRICVCGVDFGDESDSGSSDNISVGLLLHWLSDKSVRCCVFLLKNTFPKCFVSVKTDRFRYFFCVVLQVLKVFPQNALHWFQGFHREMYSIFRFYGVRSSYRENINDGNSCLTHCGHRVRIE